MIIGEICDFKGYYNNFEALAEMIWRADDEPAAPYGSTVEQRRRERFLATVERN